MAKEIVGQIKLQIPAGQANPAPPVGPALGQQGVNIMAFCKEFNAATQKQAGDILPVVITVYKDKSFTFITKSPPASILIKKAANIAAGSKEPNKQKVGKLSKKQVLDIVKVKMKDLNARDEAAAYRIIAGTARQMGVDSLEVVAGGGIEKTGDSTRLQYSPGTEHLTRFSNGGLGHHGAAIRHQGHDILVRESLQHLAKPCAAQTEDFAQALFNQPCFRRQAVVHDGGPDALVDFRRIGRIRARAANGRRGGNALMGFALPRAACRSTPFSSRRAHE